LVHPIFVLSFFREDLVGFAGGGQVLSRILLVGVHSKGLALNLRSSHQSLPIFTTDMVRKIKEMESYNKQA